MDELALSLRWIRSSCGGATNPKGSHEGHAVFQPPLDRGLPAGRGGVRMERAQPGATIATRRPMVGRAGRRDGLLPVLSLARQRVRLSICRRHSNRPDAAAEMGMGTATVQIQHAADRLGLPLERSRSNTAIRPARFSGHGRRIEPDRPSRGFAGGGRRSAPGTAEAGAETLATCRRETTKRLKRAMAGSTRTGDKPGKRMSKFWSARGKESVEAETNPRRRWS